MDTETSPVSCTARRRGEKRNVYSYFLCLEMCLVSTILSTFIKVEDIKKRIQIQGPLLPPPPVLDGEEEGGCGGGRYGERGAHGEDFAESDGAAAAPAVPAAAVAVAAPAVAAAAALGDPVGASEAEVDPEIIGLILKIICRVTHGDF